jgi:hypothetical protein
MFAVLNHGDGNIADVDLTFNHVVSNVGNSMNPTTGIFKAPVLGRAVLIGVVPYRAHNKNSCMQCTATVACAVTSHPNCKE